LATELTTQLIQTHRTIITTKITVFKTSRTKFQKYHTRP